jgi:hypothetical protein
MIVEKNKARTPQQQISKHAITKMPKLCTCMTECIVPKKTVVIPSDETVIHIQYYSNSPIVIITAVSQTHM